MALKAFKKRLKLTKLDEESKLGRSPLSTGGKSQITAIIPPNQYPTRPSGKNSPNKANSKTPAAGSINSSPINPLQLNAAFEKHHLFI